MVAEKSLGTGQVLLTDEEKIFAVLKLCWDGLNNLVAVSMNPYERAAIFCRHASTKPGGTVWTETTPASKAVWTRARALLWEKDEGVSDAAAEGHGADHNEVIGSSVVSLGPDERSVCVGVSSPELGSGRVVTLNLHFGGRATILSG